MTYSDQEIYENRLKWIEYLKRPETKKHTQALESFDEPEARCCIGHACHVLGMEPSRDNGKFVKYGGVTGYAPFEVVNKMGLWTRSGSTITRSHIVGGFTTLASVNDFTSSTPQMIGEYLESVILGGRDTPFKPIEVST